MAGRGLQVLGQGIIGAGQQFAKIPGAIAESRDIKALQELLAKPQVREFVDMAFTEGKKLQDEEQVQVPFMPKAGTGAPLQGPQEPPTLTPTTRQSFALMLKLLQPLNRIYLFVRRGRCWSTCIP